MPTRTNLTPYLTSHLTPGDIWSVGCVVVEMATGKPPYAESGFDNLFAVMLHIAKDGTRPRTPAKMSAEAGGFMQRCFEREPQRRPSASELLEHGWLVADVAVDLE